MDDAKADAARIEPLLRYLPLLESRKAGAWQGGERGPGGVITMPWFEYSEEFRAFTRACGENGWLEPFDWTSWQDEALAYFKAPERLGEADVATIRKLLTLHVRKDRFFEGHLAAMVESGHLAAIVRRLQDISAELG